MMDAKASDALHTGAAVIRLPAKLIRDIRKASDAHLLTGDSPRVRINGTVHDLQISSTAPTELYTTNVKNASHDSVTEQSWADWELFGSVLHKIEVKSGLKSDNADTAGADAAAVAFLEEKMASYAKEKEANQTHITTAVLSNPRNKHQQLKTSATVSRNSPAKRQFNDAGMVSAANPGKHDIIASAAGNNPRLTEACRYAVVHFLAIGPASIDQVRLKTHIPRDQAVGLVQKLARPAEDGTDRFVLSDRAYKELNVWKFKYPSSADRQQAIEHAIRAYDRLRLGEGDKVWQALLRPSERGKGIWLSKLGRLGDNTATRGFTPQHLQETNSNNNEATSESKVAGTTTGSGMGSSPRPSSGKNATVLKRLFAKNPQKARAIEDAKAKKRKERKAATEERVTGERPPKRQAVRKPDPKIKSEEFVHSSSDESGQGSSTQPVRHKDTKPLPRQSNPTAHSKSKSIDNSQPVSNAPSVTTKTTSTAPKLSKPTASGQATPRQGSNNPTSAPASKHKSQLSPRKPDSRPSVPSPLGPRPRVASDVSERGAQRPKTAKPAGVGATTTPSVTEPPRSSKLGPGASSQTLNAVSRSNVPQKRKAVDGVDATDRAKTKHRKSDSVSSQSAKSNSSANHNSTEHTSPDSGGTSDSSPLALNGLTFAQGVAMAKKFRDQYYPAYAKMYDDQQSREARGEAIGKEERERLWEMHLRLEQMKREIHIASKRDQRVAR